jgi:hypothetical protein
VIAGVDHTGLRPKLAPAHPSATSADLSISQAKNGWEYGLEFLSQVIHSTATRSGLANYP